MQKVIFFKSLTWILIQIVKPTFETVIDARDFNTGLHTDGIFETDEKVEIPVLSNFHQDEEVQNGAESNENKYKVQFPDRLPQLNEMTSSVVPNTTVQDIKPHCDQEDPFCESVDEYPSGLVLRLLKIHPAFPDGSFQKEKKTNSMFVAEAMETVHLSLSSDWDSDPICPFRTEMKYPKAANNNHGEAVFIVNQEGYYQGVEVEICLVDNGPCSTVFQPYGYTCTCTQKFLKTKLFYVDSAEQVINTDTFNFASHCTPKITFVGV